MINNLFIQIFSPKKFWLLYFLINHRSNHFSINLVGISRFANKKCIIYPAPDNLDLVTYGFAKLKLVIILCFSVILALKSSKINVYICKTLIKPDLKI